MRVDYTILFNEEFKAASNPPVAGLLPSNVCETSFLRVVVFGTVFVFGVGAGCHFLYEASDCNFAMGLLVAVNESVFEHVKLLILPIFIFWLVDYLYLLRFLDLEIAYRGMCQHVAAAAVALFWGMLVMVGVYLFTFLVLGFEQLWFDILLFFFSSLAAQLSGWQMAKSVEPSVLRTVTCGVVLVLTGFCHVYFTDHPQDIEAIFKDPRGFYGRPERCGGNHVTSETQ